MRPWLRASIAGLLLLGIAVGACCYANRRKLAPQWHCYRVGAAESFQRAREEIAWFETGTDHTARLAELTRKWGTGNRQFDLYLAQHLHHADCSKPLRETFSQELGRREELLPRWAHYWSFRAPQEPDREIASILRSVDVLASEKPPPPITWREVLNLQAVFQLIGAPRHARDLSPTNWHEHYRRWQQTRASGLPRVTRPQQPFASP